MLKQCCSNFRIVPAFFFKMYNSFTAQFSKLESVFMKHYAPNICLPLKMAKLAKGHNSRKFLQIL